MKTAKTYRLGQHYSFKAIWRTTFPILISLVMEQLLGMTDTAFLGRVGEIELGASAVAGVYYTILFMVGFGFATGAQIIMGRRNGEARETGEGFGSIGRVFWQSVWFLIALAIVTVGLSLFLSPVILKSALSSDNVFGAANTYVQWRVPGLLFAFLSAMFRAFYVATRKTASLTFNSIVMVGSNILLDWLLIFGHWGLPAMGIQGAALSSTIAEGISLLFFVVWASFTADRKYGLQKPVRPRWKELKQILPTASWVMVEDVLNVAVWLLFFLFIEHLGEQQLAIANIIRSVAGMPYVITAAFASTAATLVTNIIGEGNPDGVVPVIRRVNLLCASIMVPMVAFFALCPHLIISIFTDIPALVQDSVPTLWVLCAITILTIPYNVYLNAVAGTGDTRMCLWADVIALVVYSIYCTVVIGILKSNIAVCWTADGVYQGLIWLVCAIYIHRGSWRSKRI